MREWDGEVGGGKGGEGRRGPVAVDSAGGRFVGAVVGGGGLNLGWWW